MERAGVFLRAIVFKSRTSPEVQARRFVDLLAINPPFQERPLVSLTGAKEKSGESPDVGKPRHGSNDQARRVFAS
jgi:hypothetical protein